MNENLELLEHEKTELILFLKELDPSDPKYFDTIQGISDIQKLIEKETPPEQITQATRKWWNLSQEQIFELIKLGGAGAFNIFTLIYVTNWEQFHNWTSKVFSFMYKPKL